MIWLLKARLNLTVCSHRALNIGFCSVKTTPTCGFQTLDMKSVFYPVSYTHLDVYKRQRHNEITAMRAAGVSLWRLCVPYLVVGLAASVVLFWLNEWCVPRSANWAERILNRHVQKPGDAGTQDEFRNFGFTNARDHRTWFIACLLYTSHPVAGWSMPVTRRWLVPQNLATHWWTTDGAAGVVSSTLQTVSVAPASVRRGFAG